MENIGLAIYYTLPYQATETEIEYYNQLLRLAGAAANHQIPFEMIGFQSCPGRFLSDSVVYQQLNQEGDQALPITVFNGNIVKTGLLPSLTEFEHWYCTLSTFPLEQLQAEAKEIKNVSALHVTECSSGCMSCCANCHNPACGGYADDDSEYDESLADET